MIRVLQRRVEEKEVLYQKALMRTTLSSGKRLVGIKKEVYVHPITGKGQGSSHRSGGGHSG